MFYQQRTEEETLKSFHVKISYSVPYHPLNDKDYNIGFEFDYLLNLINFNSIKEKTSNFWG